MTVEELVDTLGLSGMEPVVTALEPADGSRHELGDLPAHVVQYYNKIGNDTIVVVIGNEHLIVAVDGKFDLAGPQMRRPKERVAEGDAKW
jgi:hypothetical protein